MTQTATDVADLDGPAQVLPCGRCHTPALLRPGWLCAGCIADIGLHAPDEHAAWHDAVKRQVAEETREGDGQ